MKPVKKETLTIVVLFIVAVLGVYVVNASTTAPAPVAPPLKSQTVHVEKMNQDHPVLIAAGMYGCADCEILRNMADACSPDKSDPCHVEFMNMYASCRGQYNDCGQ